MKPISKKNLVNSLTIYNRHHDEDTGVDTFYRTILKLTRIMSDKVAYSNSTLGASSTKYTELLIDRVNSIATGSDGSAKTYLPPQPWVAEPERDKYWTLQGGDYVLEGGDGPAITPDNESDVTSLEHYKVSQVKRVLDKDGSIHHWKVQLV